MKNTSIHENTPALKNLKEIQATLLSKRGRKSAEDQKKINAITMQIERIESRIK